MVLNGCFSRFASLFHSSLALSLPLLFSFNKIEHCNLQQHVCALICLIVCLRTKGRLSYRIGWREQHAQIYMPRLTFNLPFFSIRFDMTTTTTITMLGAVKRIVQIDCEAFALGKRQHQNQLGNASLTLAIAIAITIAIMLPLYISCDLSNTNNGNSVFHQYTVKCIKMFS